jgi:hypothetical protein
VTPGDDSGRGTLIALLAAHGAPEAEVRTYRIGGAADAPYEYWPAMELAQAIFKAVSDGNDIILTGAAFSRDFPFLMRACQLAYLRNVMIIVPAGQALSGSTEGPAIRRLQFGHRRRADGMRRPFLGAVHAVEVDGVAPASGPGPLLERVCGQLMLQLATLISPQIAQTGEAPGQYVRDRRDHEEIGRPEDPRLRDLRSQDRLP